VSTRAALKGLGRAREALDACKRGLASVQLSTSVSAADAKKPQGYPELTRLAHALNTELAKKAPPPSAASSEQEQELVQEYNELVADVEDLNALLERKVREIRMLEITSESLGKLPVGEDVPRTFVPLGRMFLQRPLPDVQKTLSDKLDRARKEVELGRNKMALSEQRLKEMSGELQEIMGR